MTHKRSMNTVSAVVSLVLISAAAYFLSSTISHSAQSGGTGPRKEPATLPVDAKAPFDKGVASANQNDWTSAAKSFEEARKAAPYSSDVLHHLAEAESRIPGRELRAIAWFKAYLAAAPNGDKAASARDQVNKLKASLDAMLHKLVGQAKQMAVENNRGLGEVINAQAQIGDIPAALETVRAIKVEEPGLKDLELSRGYRDIAVIQAGALGDQLSFTDLEARDPEGAISTAKLITHPDYLCEAQLAIAKAQAKLGKVEDAKATLVSAREKRLDYYNNRAKEKSSDVQTCGYQLGDIGKTQAELGDFAGAQQTLNLIPPSQYADRPTQSIREAIDRSREKEAFAKGKAPDQLIKEAIRRGDFDDAEKLTEQMDDKSHDKMGSYAELITALQKANKAQQAQRVLAKAKLKFNPAGYSSEELIDAAAQLGDFETANAMVQAFKPTQRERPMDHYLKPFAIAKAKAGDISAALASANQIKDESSKGSTISEIAKIQLSNGDAAGSLRTAELITGDYYRDERQYEVAAYLAKNRQFAEAQKIAEGIKKIETRDRAVRDIVSGLAGTAQFADAASIAESISKVSERANAYRSIAADERYAGHGAKSLESLKHWSELCAKADGSEKVNCYLDTASAYLDAERLADAQQTLALARGFAQALPDPKKKSEALDRLRGIQDRCLTPAESNRTDYLIWDAIGAVKDIRDRNYKSVADRRAKLGDVAGAREILPLQPDSQTSSGNPDYGRNEIRLAIAKVQLENGNISAAKSALEQLTAQVKEGSQRDSVYTALAQVQMKAGELAEVEKTLANIKPFNVFLEVVSSADYSLVSLATAYLGKGDIAAAKRCADKVTNLSKLLDRTLFEEIKKSGQLQWGKELIAKAEPKVTRDYELDQVARAKIDVGDIEGAKRMLPSIPDEYKRNVYQNLVEAGDIDWVKQDAKFKKADDEIGIVLTIAKAEAKKGDKGRAEATLRELTKKRLTISELGQVASIQNTISGPSAARQTLALIHPQDTEFSDWADLTIIGYLEDPAAARKMADGIKDSLLKSRAYASLMWKEKDPGTKEKIAAAIEDPFLKSQANRGFVSKEASDGKWDHAIELANSIAIEELKLLAFQQVLATALVREDFQTAEKVVEPLPESESKACLAMRVARAAAGAAKKDVFERAIVLAQKSIEKMPDDYWKARAFDQMAAIATSGQDTGLAQTSSGKALQIAAKLTGDDKQNWENHFSAQFPLGAQLSTAQVDKYARFVESDLKDKLYTDFAGYIRDIETKADEADKENAKPPAKPVSPSGSKKQPNSGKEPSLGDAEEEAILQSMGGETKEEQPKVETSRRKSAIVHGSLQAVEQIAGALRKLDDLEKAQPKT